jgi:hypothetical protein
MNTYKPSSKKVVLVEKLIAGATKHYPNASDPLTFGNETRTVSALTQVLQAFVNLRNAVVTSQAATKEKVAAERAQAPALLVVIDEFVSFVRATFGKSPEALADFGLTPPKGRKPQTAEQIAAAVARRKATRAKRNTMGKQQKKAVKAAVQVTVTSTPVAEVPVASPPAASPPAPGGGSGTAHS